MDCPIVSAIALTIVALAQRTAEPGSLLKKEAPADNCYLDAQLVPC